MVEIEFINHASYVVKYNNIKLIIDPWIEGLAFNDGWMLIEPTKFTYSDFSKVTHIWFSHEHPDHFSPNNLKNIPQEYRSEITVLFQVTNDKKVIGFCKSLNFKECIELPPNWYMLENNFKILNVPHTDGDSWMCIDAGGEYILNLNDCVFENDNQLKNLKEKIDTPKIDVLLTQFSYANWVGNKDDKATRVKHAKNKLNEIEKQIKHLKPNFIIPFASFVWFCHQENFYMNDEVNTIAFINDHLLSNFKVTPIILFPSDCWTLGQVHDSNRSVEKWMMSYEKNIKFNKSLSSKIYLKDDIIKIGNQFVQSLKKSNTIWLHLFLRPTYIFIHDFNKSFKLSLKGFQESNKNENDCDISMGSDSVFYCFKFLWGGSTTRINGRYQVPSGGNFYSWKLYFQVSELNNHGNKFDLTFILLSLIKAIKRKFTFLAT